MTPRNDRRAGSRAAGIKLRPKIAHFSDRKDHAWVVSHEIIPPIRQTSTGCPCREDGIEFVSCNTCGEVKASVLSKPTDCILGIAICVPDAPKRIAKKFLMRFVQHYFRLLLAETKRQSHAADDHRPIQAVRTEHARLCLWIGSPQFLVGGPPSARTVAPMEHRVDSSCSGKGLVHSSRKPSEVLHLPC